MTAIKICGVTRAEDAKLCEELAVDFVGLNFVPTSPRLVTLAQARELMKHFVTSKPVGIFQNNTPEEVLAVTRELHLPYVQIYDGEEALLLMLRSEGRRIIRAFRTIPAVPVLETALALGDLVLLDGKKNGIAADQKAITVLPMPIRQSIFLAGGLDASNVAEAIKMIQPFGVDCASGVESAPGIKDHHLLKTFVASVLFLSERQEKNQKKRVRAGSHATALASAVADRRPPPAARASRLVAVKPSDGGSFSNL